MMSIHFIQDTQFYIHNYSGSITQLGGTRNRTRVFLMRSEDDNRCSLSAHLDVNLIESEWTTSIIDDAYDLAHLLASVPIHIIEEHILPNMIFHTGRIELNLKERNKKNPEVRRRAVGRRRGC
jgi:hypothetical protein